MADKWYSQLQEGRILPESELKELCSKVKEILIEESNIITISPPVIICGDLHGQFYDLLELFKKSGGPPPEQKFIFLGDYIDRGSNSVETIELLICLKCLYPDKTVLIRGNHESRNISFIYGFYDEINRKYGTKVLIAALSFDFGTLSKVIAVLCLFLSNLIIPALFPHL